MKKTLLLFPVALLALVGCDNKAANESSEGSKETTNQASGETVESLEISREQARANLVNKGQTDGIELKYNAITDEDEPVTFLVGMKGEFIWVGNSEEKFLHPDAISYSAETRVMTSYSWNGSDYDDIPIPASDSNIDSFNAAIDSYTSLFYLGHTLINEQIDLVKIGSDTYLGRNVTKYHYEFNYPGASAYYEVLIDAEIGITLSCKVGGATLEESGSAAIEVTSIKLGDDVINPIYA